MTMRTVIAILLAALVLEQLLVIGLLLVPSHRAAGVPMRRLPPPPTPTIETNVAPPSTSALLPRQL